MRDNEHDPICDAWSDMCKGYYCAPGDPGGDCEHFYCLCELIALVRADDLRRLDELLSEMANLGSPDAKAALAADPSMTTGDWWWCLRGVQRSQIEIQKGLYRSQYLVMAASNEIAPKGDAP